MGKAVRKNRRSAGEETKKTIKNIIQKMVLSRPFRLLDTTFNIHILTWGFTPQSQNRANVMPVICLLCSLRDPAVNLTDKWKIQIVRTGRPYKIWQHEMPRRLGCPIKRDGGNQNEQSQNHESVKGKQVLCHVEKRSDHTKLKRSSAP